MKGLLTKAVLIVGFVALATVLAVVLLSDRPVVSEPPAASGQSEVAASDPQPSSSQGPSQPSRQAMQQWLRTSGEAKAAVSAAEYQMDDPRPLDEQGRRLPFRENLLPASFSQRVARLAPGDTIQLKLFPDVDFEAQVTGVWSDDAGNRFMARLADYPAGHRWSHSLQPDAAWGLVEVPSQNRAYEILRQPSGRYLVKEWLFTEMVCARSAPDGSSADAGMPLPPIGQDGAPVGGGTSGAGTIASLSSRPEAVATIYLDFDGEVVTGTAWADGATINALPARMSAQQIEETWRRVSSHFGVFDVNVTTDRQVFDAAPADRKTHCIITPTRDAAPDAGGVAYLFSFTNPSPMTKICWSFADQNPADAALVISHEVGHTLGLYHHGRIAVGGEPREEYYLGHGAGETGWGPFMGAPYGKNLLQWSKGEYARANNSSQDDLVIISTPQRIPFLPDDHGDSPATASEIEQGSAITAQVQRNTDADFFRVELDPGPQTISVTLTQGTMLDVEMRVYRPDGSLLRAVNPPDSLAVSTVLDFPEWQEVLIGISGTGKPEVLGTGYSDYSSIGTFTLLAGEEEGTVPVVSASPSSFPGFRATESDPSPAASFTVRGRRLTGPISVRAPPPYEISIDGETYVEVVEASDGDQIFVRLGSGSAPGVARSSLTLDSAGASTRILPLVGIVLGPPDSSTRFVQVALEKLHYFDGDEPPSARFHHDYVLQFIDYYEFFEGCLSAGFTDHAARVETIARMTGFRPSTGNFSYDSGYLPMSVAFGAMGRLGMVPTEDQLRAFVRTAREADDRAVPIQLTVGGFNGLRGAPWSASRGMAQAFRDLFASRAFRDRYGDVRLMSSSAFYQWMQTNMFPGRAMGADGPAVLLDLLDNGFATDYPTLAAQRAMGRGAAAAFRSVYATVLLTEMKGSNDGSDVEAPFQRRLHHASLRYQLWGDWLFGASSPELSRSSLADLLRPPTILDPGPLEVPAEGGLSFNISVADSNAPINSTLSYSVVRSDGNSLGAAVTVTPDGLVSWPSGALAPGLHSVRLQAVNLAGASSRLVDVVVHGDVVQGVEPLPGPQPGLATGMGAAWAEKHGLEGCVQTAAHDDGDAFCLLTEYAFGLDPNTNDTVAHTFRVNGGYIQIEWNALSEGAAYILEHSTDLKNWTPVPNVSQPADLGQAGPFHRRKRVTLIRSGAQKFYRITALFEDTAQQ